MGAVRRDKVARGDVIGLGLYRSKLMKRMICQRPSLLRPKMSRPCSSVVFVVSVHTSRTAAMSPSANISLMLSAGWPDHRRAEATPSFGRLCPAMTRMLLVQLLAAL